MVQSDDMTNTKLNQMLADPCVPFWVKDVIKVALQKDAVDAANWLETLAETFVERCNS